MELISRQQAIKAIEEEWDGCCSEYPATQIIYDTTEAIERLPIIQPEITHEQAVAYLQSTGWMQEHDRQMMLDGVHKLTAQPEPHWIPVTERLPEEEGEYLVTSVYQYYRDGRKTYKTTVDRWSRNGAGKEWVATSNDAHIAWMPFPEPYKRG